MPGYSLESHFKNQWEVLMTSAAEIEGAIPEDQFQLPAWIEKAQTLLEKMNEAKVLSSKLDLELVQTRSASRLSRLVEEHKSQGGDSSDDDYVYSQAPSAKPQKKDKYADYKVVIVDGVPHVHGPDSEDLGVYHPCGECVRGSKKCTGVIGEKCRPCGIAKRARCPNLPPKTPARQEDQESPSTTAKKTRSRPTKVNKAAFLPTSRPSAFDTPVLRKRKSAPSQINSSKGIEKRQRIIGEASETSTGGIQNNNSGSDRAHKTHLRQELYTALQEHSTLLAEHSTILAKHSMILAELQEMGDSVID